MARKAGERIFVAGQIGLLPADLTLPIPDSFAMEATLAQQYVRRIVKAMQEGTGEGFHGWMESCICWISGPSSSFAAKRDIARRAWSQWNKSHKMPFLIVQTLALPKEAQVEWQVTWQTGRLPLSDEDSEMEESARRTIRKGFMAGQERSPNTKGLHTDFRSPISDIFLSRVDLRIKRELSRYNRFAD